MPCMPSCDRLLLIQHWMALSFAPMDRQNPHPNLNPILLKAAIWYMPCGMHCIHICVHRTGVRLSLSLTLTHSLSLSLSLAVTCVGCVCDVIRRMQIGLIVTVTRHMWLLLCIAHQLCVIHACMHALYYHMPCMHALYRSRAVCYKCCVWHHMAGRQ